MTAANLHAWCVEHLPAHLAGLLDESEEERFRAHFADCEDCRRSAEALQEAIDQRVERVDGHVPPALIGRWSSFRTELRGLERALVRQHLHSCDDCRADLEALGHEPVLEVMPELELGFDLGPTPERAQERAAPRRAHLPPAERDWGWLGSDGLSALLAPALMLRVTRGDAAANTVEIDPQTRAVALRLPLPPEVSPEAEVHVEVDSPAGAPLLRERCRLKDLAPPHLLILANRGQPLSPGTYRMRIASAEPGGFTLETSFDLRAESSGKD